MTRKYLHEWYSNRDITYSEKLTLNKMGVEDHWWYDLQYFTSSSSLGSSSGTITVYHPQIPFKKKHDIIRHIVKLISYEYGKYSYSFGNNNCENAVNHCVFGFDGSVQVDNVPTAIFGLKNHGRNFVNAISGSDVEGIMRDEGRKIDNLTSSYSYEKERIERYIRQSENNRYYNRSKYQIEQEKFEERIVVYPKDWCRIS